MVFVKTLTQQACPADAAVAVSPKCPHYRYMHR